MTSPATSIPLLTVDGLWKSYGQPVLSDVQLQVHAGQVHALVGENGAGKSTLSRIVSGLVPADRGELRLHGQVYRPRSKQEGERAGVRMVMQELNLISTLTVAESLCLDELPSRWGWIDRVSLREKAVAALEGFGLGAVDPAQLVGSLGIGRQQLIEIAAVLSRRCDLLILDEPTAALTTPEVESLFRQVRGLKARGAGVIYISHRLEEIREIADWITVLRDGQVVASAPVADVSREQIIRWMVGREIQELPARPPATSAAVGLRVEGLCCGRAVREVSFEARQGEVFGIAGLMGAGRTETVRAVFGADVRDSGDVRVGEVRIPPGSPRASVLAGLALLTEDRKAQGLLLPLGVRENIALSRLNGLSRHGGWVDRASEEEEVARWGGKLSIRCASMEQPVRELSGGNQQKVLVARWLARNSRVVIFDEPTRGVDVGARYEIHQMLLALVEAGKCVVVVSSDMNELFALCDRIAVMSAGRMVGVFDRGTWTEEAIMAAALSGYRTGGAP